MGVSAKFVITGDMSQIDLPHKTDSGLAHAFKILQRIRGIAFVQFDEGDIVRHRLVKDIVKAYDKDGERELAVAEKIESKRKGVTKGAATESKKTESVSENSEKNN
ncbi:MAG: PhoH family protein, partial [Odoribacter sp.]|nr:PhoH family protein [Odoribacter sp.]